MKSKFAKLILLATGCGLILLFGITALALSNGVSHQVTILTSGDDAGTELFGLAINPDGTATRTSKEVVDTMASHGAYMSPSGIIYADGFLASVDGIGVKVLKKVNGVWTEQANKNLGPPSSSANLCDMHLKNGHQNPETGQLVVSDMSNGMDYFVNMNGGSPAWANTSINGGPAGYLGAATTNCGISFSDINSLAWSSGHTNLIYTWDTGTTLPLPTGDKAYLLKNVADAQDAGGVTGHYKHQNRIVKGPNGTEYLFIGDGAANQLEVINTQSNQTVGHISLNSDDVDNVGFMTDGPSTNKATSVFAVGTGFTNGTIYVIRAFKADGSPNVDGPGQEIPTVTATIPADNPTAKHGICSTDVVNVDGNWQRG